MPYVCYNGLRGSEEAAGLLPVLPLGRAGGGGGPPSPAPGAATDAGLGTGRPPLAGGTETASGAPSSDAADVGAGGDAPLAEGADLGLKLGGRGAGEGEGGTAALGAAAGAAAGGAGAAGAGTGGAAC